MYQNLRRTTGHASAENICQVFVAINTYLKQAGFRKCIYKPIPWIYQQLPAEEDLYALFKECRAQICARNIAAVIDLKHPLKWYNIRKSGARKALGKESSLKKVRITKRFGAF